MSARGHVRRADRRKSGQGRIRLRLAGAALAALCLGAGDGEAGATSPVTVLPHSGGPAFPSSPLEILDTDYPLEAMLLNEQGRTELLLLIDPGGRVTLAQVASSSGSPRLDRQAAEIASRRWAFEPLSSAGAAVARELKVAIDWTLPLRPADDLMTVARESRGKAPARVFSDEVPVRVIIFDEAPERNLPKLSRSQDGAPCYSRPLLEEPTPAPASSAAGIEVRQWLHLAADGTVDEVLLYTAKGWMRLSEPIVAQANRSPLVEAAAAGAGGQACWVRTQALLSPR